jgi:hypothetical protein
MDVSFKMETGVLLRNEILKPTLLLACLVLARLGVALFAPSGDLDAQLFHLLV